MKRRIPLIIGLLGAGVILIAILFFSSPFLLPGSPQSSAGQSSPTPFLTPVTSLTRIPTFSPTWVPVTTPFPAPVSAETPPSSSGITIAGDPYPISPAGLEQRVHELINQQRAIHNLPPLSRDPALSEIARDHSEDMAARNYFAHVDPDGETPTDRAADAGYNCRKEYASYYTYGIAENLFQNNLYSAATYYSNRKTEYDWSSQEEIAQTTVGGWMNSTGHRENILTPSFDREGIGVAIAPDSRVYITEDFC